MTHPAYKRRQFLRWQKTAGGKRYKRRQWTRYYARYAERILRSQRHSRWWKKWDYAPLSSEACGCCSGESLW